MEFRLLGAVEVVHDGQALALGGSRERAVLTLLLLAPNRVVPTDRLVEDLWPDRPPGSAVRALRVFVSRLRRALREAGESSVVATRAPGYIAQVDPRAIDAVRFEAAVARGRAQAFARDASGAAATLSGALSLWRGPAMADVKEVPVLRAEAARLEEVRLGALELRIDAELACGRHADLVAELEALTHAHPLRERLWANRMVALYRAGRQAEALRAYQDLRDVLGNELGLDPCPELRLLERNILRQDSTLEWVPVPAASGADDLAPIGIGDTTSAVLPDHAGPRFAARTPYVGREHERAELARFVDEAIRGRGGFALISGEPGVGKTRLTEEISVAAARRGVRIRVGRCHETEGAPPYLPFVEMFEQALEAAGPAAFREMLGENAPEVTKLVPRLRRLFPDLPAPLELPPEQERRYLFNSVRDCLARASVGSPLLLVLDDLHWADEPTLLLLEHLAERIPEMRVLVVGTYREHEVTAGHPLARTLDGLIRRSLVTPIGLDRLSDQGVAGMLAGLAGRTPPPSLVALVHAQTEGNPFFVEEMYKHLAEEGQLFDAVGEFRAEAAIGDLDLPESLRLVLGRRLEHLGTGTRRALESAAVVGRAFSFELLEAMGDVGSDELLDALDEAGRARLIGSLAADHRDSRLSFAHELVRVTILAGLSRPRRQRLHLRAALAMERLAGESTEAAAAQIAEHLTSAGAAADPATLRSYLSLAGRHAMSAVAFEDALRHFERALSIRAPVEPTRAAELLVDVALARRSLGRLQESFDIWLEAVRAYEALGDGEGVARICLEAAQDLLWANRDQEAFDLARRGAAALGGARSPLRARMLGWAAGTGAWIAPFDIADELSREAILLAGELDDDRLLGGVLFNDALFRLAFYQVGQAAESARKGAALLRSGGDRWSLTMALSCEVFTLVELGRFDGVEALEVEVSEAAERLGHYPALFGLHWVAATRQLAVAPDLDRFEASARLAADMFAGLDFESCLLPRLGLGKFMRGDWDAALELMAEGARHELPNRLHGMAVGPLFQTMAYRGERAAALAVLEAERATLPRPGKPNGYGSWQFLGYVVEGLHVLGERDACAALYPLVVEFLTTGVVLTSFQGRLVERVAGMAAAAGRHWDLAERHFQTAIRQAQDIPHRIEAAETARFLAHMLLDRSAGEDRARAADLLDDALGCYHSIGMARHVQLASDLRAEV